MSSATVYTHQEILPVIRGVALCILLSAVDQTIVVPAVPAMAADLHCVHHFAWIVTAYLVTGTAATPVFGKLSDLYGRRRLLRPAIILFIIASMGCALAQTLPQLLALRAVQGIGGAGLFAIAQTAIADVVPPRERGRYQIYMSGMWGIASIAGPLLGGVLTDAVSWRAIFWINLPLGAIAFIASSAALKLLPVHPPVAHKIDYGGAVLVMLSITCWLVLVSSGGQDIAWQSPAAFTLLAAAGVCTVLAIWQEARATAPILPLSLFSNRVILCGLLLSFSNSLCTFGASFLLPLYFQYALGTNAIKSGIYTTPFLISFVISSYFGGQLGRLLGHTKLPMLAGMAVCVLAFLLLVSIGVATPVALTLLYMSLLGGGIGIVQPNITVAIQNAATRAEVGSATSCMLLFRAIGGACGATLAGSLLLARVTREAPGTVLGHPDPALRGAFASGFHDAFAACAVAAVLGAIITALMRDQILRSQH